MALESLGSSLDWGIEPVLLGEYTSPYPLYVRVACYRIASRLGEHGIAGRSYGSEVFHQRQDAVLGENNRKLLTSDQVFVFPSQPGVRLQPQEDDSQRSRLPNDHEAILTHRTAIFERDLVTSAFRLVYNAEEPPTTRLYNLTDQHELPEAVNRALIIINKKPPTVPPKMPKSLGGF